jgi:hypothetical protein
MKEGFDKEIDSLLRRRARGAVTSYADGDGALTNASAHLDADELGAFAEGALPSPARLAAASHLADCDRCRGVVVALSRALGGGAEVKQAAVAIPASAAAKKPASWGTWVAALFSPRALRYAAPVLALSVVAVVSFVALRTRDSGALNDTMSARPQMEVARVQPETAGSASVGTAVNDNRAGLVAQNPKEPSANKDSAGTTARQSADERGPSVSEATGTATGAPAEDAAAPPPPAPVSTEAPPEMAKAAPRSVVEESEAPAKSDAKSEGRDKQKNAREAESSDEVAANEQAAQQRSRAAQNRAGEVQMPDGGSRNQKRDGNVSNIYGGNAGSSAAQPKESERDDRAANAARRAPSSRRGEQKQELDETARSGETREVAGHRFRREGSAWVDVKYKSSMPSTGVRRGTETFRSLVADIPVLGRVAEQIPGAVTVVVNGRAYSIR